MKSKKAFTLIEVLLVVVILAALAAMIMPRLSGRADQAKNAIAQTDIQTNLSTALKLYELDMGRLPTTAQGLEALRKRPSSGASAKKWNGPYIEKEAIDPWGNPYIYISPGTHRSDYDLYSKGKDIDSSDDDITNW